MITEDTPRHNTRTPSVDDIRVKALPRPVYTAAGEVANTCIRVCTDRIPETNGDEHSKREGNRGQRTKEEKKKPHFDAVNREHHRVLRDTGLQEKCLVSSHPGRAD